MKPSGILTFTTNGIPHLEIERRFGQWLDQERKKAFKAGQQNEQKKMAEEAAAAEAPITTTAR